MYRKKGFSMKQKLIFLTIAVISLSSMAMHCAAPRKGHRTEVSDSVTTRRSVLSDSLPSPKRPAVPNNSSTHAVNSNTHLGQINISS